MSEYTQTACPECDSSDAFTIYDDGGYCFSCNYSTKKVNTMTSKEIDTLITMQASSNMVEEIKDLNSFAITSRGISNLVAQVLFYNLKRLA